MGLLDRLAPRKGDPDVRPQGLASSRVDDPVFATKALHKFLHTLTSRELPVLLDLGPLVGSNVSYFGEQLGCKIFVEDIFADLDRHVREGKLDQLPEFLEKRFRRPTARSTASCAGISWIISIDRRPRSWRPSWRACCDRKARCSASSASAPPRGRALHEVHHRRRREPEVPRRIPRCARPSGDSAEPRHHPAVLEPARLRLVPAEDTIRARSSSGSPPDGPARTRHSSSTSVARPPAHVLRCRYLLIGIMMCAPGVPGSISQGTPVPSALRRAGCLRTRRSTRASRWAPTSPTAAGCDPSCRTAGTTSSRTASA